MKSDQDASLGGVLTLDPATFRVGGAGRIPFLDRLRERYHDDLNLCCRQMLGVKQRLTAKGCSSDFSDREAEILYLLVRHLQPDRVIEISPCHGYSTGYLLAALTANRRGELWSCEIVPEYGGVPTRDLILSNLPSMADAQRLSVIVGDAREQRIPDADLAFIDSCHEAYFAAWYMNEIVPRVRWIYVHDIVTRLSSDGPLLPKAPFIGIREQHVVLQSLALNGKSCLAAAAWRPNADVQGAASLQARVPSPDRSILMEGHRQSPTAVRLHEAEVILYEVQRLALQGARAEAMARISRIMTEDYPLYSRIAAQRVAATMGYRRVFHPETFPDLDVDWRSLTVSEFASLLELAVTAMDFTAVRRIARQARKSDLDRGVREGLVDGYLRMIGGDGHGRGHALCRWFRTVVGPCRGRL